MTGTHQGNNKIISQLNNDAQAARRLMIEVKQAVLDGASTGSNFNVNDIAARIESALNGPERNGIILGLADYIGSALEGCAPDVETWNPLERLTT